MLRGSYWCTIWLIVVSCMCFCNSQWILSFLGSMLWLYWWISLVQLECQISALKLVLGEMLTRAIPLWWVLSEVPWRLCAITLLWECPWMLFWFYKYIGWSRVRLDFMVVNVALIFSFTFPFKIIFVIFVCKLQVVLSSTVDANKYGWLLVRILFIVVFWLWGIKIWWNLYFITCHMYIWLLAERSVFW